MQENLVQLRHVHSQGIRSWTEVSKIRGIGPNVMVQIFIFCQDPATTPLPTEQPDDSGLYPGDVMELPEMPERKSSSGTDPEMPGMMSSSSSNGTATAARHVSSPSSNTTSDSGASHPTGVILHKVSKTFNKLHHF